ncbi:hypothetical protein WJX84_007633 [Apatococcus fuscideae]|uniref:DUF1989 domain-containing protein n=1 Tax=Apatococcus fuscideae TaxID=2026836 RepID=A0AAW1TA18_9CHLO
MEVIRARYGKAVHLKEGQHIKVINTHGTQVVDTWAFNYRDMTELMSMEHTRSAILKFMPAPGDPLVTNRRRPILTLLEDTCGVHDTLMSCCEIYRYQE